MHHLHFFLSSPDDVSRERQLAREVINRLQSERAYRDQLKLEVVAWDKPGAGTRMPAHLEPQEAINRRLKKPSDCDVVIVVFWARMGTPLSDNYRKPDGDCYGSGTEYEFLDGLNAAKNSGGIPEVLVYRRKQAPSVKLDDPELDDKKNQWNLVKEFFAQYRNPDGSYQNFFKEYEEPADFKELLDQDLRDFITSYLEKRLLEKKESSVPTEEPIWEPSRAPFPGLRAFTSDEAPIFFGREREADKLIEELSESDRRFIAVVGASGSGKSSLVAAGLLPALDSNAIYGSNDWIWVRFTPAELGDNPFMALANCFKSIIAGHGCQPRDLAKELETNPSVSHDIVKMALGGKPKWAEVLLFIDQFEELFTLVDVKYQRGFVDILTLAAKSERIRTIVTMRADFYHRCLDWPVLGELFTEGHVPLLAPKTGALYKMITLPAEQAGLQFEGGLPERILDDTGTEPGALALMAFTLNELWQLAKENGRVLSHNAYERFNGVHGAIGKTAEDTFKILEGENDALEDALARIFRELIEVDERGVATPRRARLSQVADESDTEVLVNALTDARLLVTNRGKDEEPTVEVAHEAIFTNWQRLGKWIETQTEDLRMLRQVRLAAAEWDKQDRATHFLWPHERLLLVSQMVKRLRPNLNTLEVDFIRPESERLLEEIDHAATTHQQRVKMGDRLAEIGDARPGVGLREDGLPDIAWCQVQGGKIILSWKAESFTACSNSFHIGKYPVTWVQYRSFVEAKDGYRKKKWWKGLAKRDKKPGEQNRKLDNHPAENVSWYDAMAFCRWLTKRMDNEIRLPTEWEWQQAATGGIQAKYYPWGPQWDSSRANTFESKLSRTTAVGLYPQGTSTVGAFDMSGNVLEWCLNEYDNPSQVELGKDNHRSVRGGCWLFQPDRARCDFRYNFDPKGRYGGLGFRVCCTFPNL